LIKLVLSQHNAFFFQMLKSIQKQTKCLIARYFSYTIVVHR